jgi:glutaredoxin
VCGQLKNYLTERNIEFENIDVSTDEKGREEMINKSNSMSVPVIDIDGDIILGFDLIKIKEKLRL